jgi:biofilm PGA synthesis protein PgaD
MANEQNSQKADEQEDLIIYHPHALNPFRKGVELTITAIGWFIWGILCRPLMLTFMWFLGFEIFYEHMIRLHGIAALVDFVFVYLTCIFIMYLSIRSWNYYNAKRFKGKDRRKSVNNVSTKDLEEYFKFSAGAIQQTQSWKNVVVSFKEDNQIFLKDMDSPTQFKGYFKSS